MKKPFEGTAVSNNQVLLPDAHNPGHVYWALTEAVHGRYIIDGDKVYTTTTGVSSMGMLSEPHGREMVVVHGQPMSFGAALDKIKDDAAKAYAAGYEAGQEEVKTRIKAFGGVDLLAKVEAIDVDDYEDEY